MEKFKFPMPTMTITQGYDIGTHKGAFALDMAGEDAGIDWVEAPFTGVVKHIESASYGNWYWFESLDKVLCANGVIDYMTVMLGHDNKMRHKVGDIVKQGEHLCAEGTSGQATGNHCHMEVGRGKYVGTWYPNQYGVYMLYNAVKPNEYMCVPDNYVIKNDGGYAWKRESEVQEPKTTQTLILPASAKSWRIYPLNKAPIISNALKNKLAPAKFGGLQYEIKGWTMPNVAIIETRDFGKVQIYVAPSTGAIIR